MGMVAVTLATWQSCHGRIDCREKLLIFRPDSFFNQAKYAVGLTNKGIIAGNTYPAAAPLALVIEEDTL